VKTAGLTALLIALATPLAADAPPVRREIEKEFRFKPTPAAAAAAVTPPAAEQMIEKLEPVVVTAPGRARELESDIERRAQALRDTRFTPLNGGGTILEHKGKRITSALELKLVSVRHGAGVSVFGLSW